MKRVPSRFRLYDSNTVSQTEIDYVVVEPSLSSRQVLRFGPPQLLKGSN
jgi:hypothetical protein